MMTNQPLTNKQMLGKFLKTAGISGALFIGGVLLLLVVTTLIFQERIQGIFLENINKNLRTQIQVKEIRLDLIRRFPNASITFSNTRVFEPLSTNRQDTLMHAQRIFLQFSLWDLIRKNYTIRQIEISNASLRPVIFADGSSNYMIWDNSPDNTNTDLSISLKRIILNQVDFELMDYVTQTRIGFRTEKLTMGGHFKGETFDLTAKGNLVARDITFGQSRLVENKPMEIDISLLVKNQSEFIFHRGSIQFNGHPFSLLGSIINSGEGIVFDTQVSGKDINLQVLLEDLPEALKKYTAGYRSKGNLIFNASVKGNYSATENPFVEASYSVHSAELHHPQNNLKLSALSFSGNFNNGKQRNLSTSTVSVTEFTSRINNGTIQGNFSMYNFLKPDLDLNVFTDANIGDLARLLRMEQIAAASGNLKATLAFRGRMSQKNRFTSQDIGMARASGNIIITNAAFRIKGNPLEYREFNGSFLFRNSDLVVEEFTGQVSSSDFNLKGTFRNIMPYLFLDHEKVFIDASLYSRNLNFDELLQQGAQESDSTYQLRFSDQLGFNLEANVVNLNFRKFKAQHIMGNASLQNKRFYASNLNFRAMEGKVQASGFIDGTRSDYLVFGCDANLSAVDIHQLFYQMGNFGQTSIVEDNIFGSMTATFRFNAQWSPTLEVDWGSLETTANIRVENGALVNYQPMLELSRFLRVGDLNRVTFSTLENQIHIKNRKIIIPEMEIESSALNLKITGEHTFEHVIDYRLQVLLSDILARKNRAGRNPQEQYGDIIDDGLGRTTLFLALTGTTDEPIFRYDYRGVREKLQADLRKERQTLKDVFRTEFGLTGKQTNDSTALQSQSTKQKELLKKQEEGEFVIEWEEKDL